MPSEDKLSNQFKTYENLAKENKKIDVAALMIDALQSQERNYVSAKQKKWAYLISIGLPPLGLLFALKYYYSEKSDAKHVANVCVVLTIISLLLTWFSIQFLFSSSGVEMNQIEHIDLNQLRDLTQ